MMGVCEETFLLSLDNSLLGVCDPPSVAFETWCDSSLTTLGDGALRIVMLPLCFKNLAASLPSQIGGVKSDGGPAQQGAAAFSLRREHHEDLHTEPARPTAELCCIGYGEKLSLTTVWWLRCQCLTSSKGGRLQQGGEAEAGCAQGGEEVMRKEGF
eukprot:c12419_g1_i1 orf=920-1387(+)